MCVDKNADETLSAARCMLRYIEQHGDSGHSFSMLKALATLTISSLEDGKFHTQFTAVNMFAEAGIDLPENIAAGTRLSPIWNRLVDKILPEREEGIQTFARNLGLTHYPWPVKDKSEGGRASAYWIERRALDDTLPSKEMVLKAGEIAYIRELNPKPSWWAKLILRNGYRLDGWRRWIFLLYGLGNILLSAVAIAAMWGLFWFRSSWATNDLSLAVIATGISIYASWISLRPLLALLRWRIVMAPAALVSLREMNVQMEIVRESTVAPFGAGTIRLVRYASTCARCSGKIELEDGGKEFPNRLIGRCTENPSEHIYSFDRSNSKGQLLR